MIEVLECLQHGSIIGFCNDEFERLDDDGEVSHTLGLEENMLS